MMLTRTKIAVALAIMTLASITGGCGGGGSGPSPSDTGIVVKGRVVLYQAQTQGVAGARVTIANYSGTSDSQGYFRIELAKNVVDPTFRITPPPSCYDYWAMYNARPVNPALLPTPLPLYNGKDLGNIYLWDRADVPPPYP